MQVLADIIFTSVFSRMVGGTRINEAWKDNIQEEWTIGIDMILSMSSSIILTGQFTIASTTALKFMPVYQFSSPGDESELKNLNLTAALFSLTSTFY